MFNVLKKRFVSSLLIIAFLLSVTPVEAATTFGLYPLKISVQEGQTFKLAVNLNPNNQKNYTVKINVKFPADLVSVSSWQFAGAWQPLSQSGYDLIDNNNGSLIKTAGYPGGLDKSATFGTITFKAKKTGTGTISFAGGSMALDETNANQYSGGNQVSLSIEKIVEKPVIVKPETPSITKPEAPATTEEEPGTTTLPVGEISSPTGVNPPIGEQPEIITITTSTPEIISPEDIKKINDNLTDLNSNLSNIVTILLIITVSILILVLASLAVLFIYLFRKRRHIDRIIIREDNAPALYERIKSSKSKSKIKKTTQKTTPKETPKTTPKSKLKVKVPKVSVKKK